jgi:hypothetical protein
VRPSQPSHATLASAPRRAGRGAPQGGSARAHQPGHPARDGHALGRDALNDDGRAARPLLLFRGRSAAGVTRGPSLIEESSEHSPLPQDALCCSPKLRIRNASLQDSSRIGIHSSAFQSKKGIVAYVLVFFAIQHPLPQKTAHSRHVNEVRHRPSRVGPNLVILIVSKDPLQRSRNFGAILFRCDFPGLQDFECLNPSKVVLGWSPCHVCEKLRYYLIGRLLQLPQNFNLRRNFWPIARATPILLD